MDMADRRFSEVESLLVELLAALPARGVAGPRRFGVFPSWPAPSAKTENTRSSFGPPH